jgi:hypothetical protein
MLTGLQSFHDWQRRQVLLQLLAERTKGLDFHSSLKNGRAHSTSLEINQLSAAKHPASF